MWHPTSGSCILAQNSLPRVPCPSPAESGPGPFTLSHAEHPFIQLVSISFSFGIHDSPPRETLAEGVVPWEKPSYESKEPSYQLSLWLVLGVVLA